MLVHCKEKKILENAEDRAINKELKESNLADDTWVANALKTIDEGVEDWLSEGHSVSGRHPGPPLDWAEAYDSCPDFGAPWALRALWALWVLWSQKIRLSTSAFVKIGLICDLPT